MGVFNKKVKVQDTRLCPQCGNEGEVRKQYNGVCCVFCGFFFEVKPPNPVLEGQEVSEEVTDVEEL
jgi:ribosomal protein L37AE/L43A